MTQTAPMGAASESAERGHAVSTHAFTPEQMSIGPNPPEIQAKVPFAMTDSVHVPRERYYDRTFYELEKKHVWAKTWQMAARLEEIPHPGDYTEYEIAGSSILIVRQQDGSVKALHNACRHRATELATGCGRFPGGQIVCPFHGWRWSIDGASSHVFMPELFDPETIKPDAIRLRECKVELWEGMVWINMDDEAPPLKQALGAIGEMLEASGAAAMRVKWWKQVIVNANWKITMEAFLEGYHLMQTHPQLTLGRGEELAIDMGNHMEYLTFRGGHGLFTGRKDSDAPRAPVYTGEDFLEISRLLAAGQDAMVLERDIHVFEGIKNKFGIDNPNFIEEAVKALFEYSEGAGIPIALPTAKTMWGGQGFVFPNYCMIPMYGNALCYRFRPHKDQPEWTVFDVWSLMGYPEGQEPERAELLGVFDKDDSEHWGLIPRQDFSNVERQQRGLHSESFERMCLSPEQETMIANLHEELDRRIAGAE